MTKILFVCLGNICRSPVAEGIMLHLVQQKNLSLTIDSAGTASYHVGEAPDRRTIANARKNGLDFSGLRARQFSVEDFENFDLIFAMDKSNYAKLLTMAKSESQRKKVKLFLEYLLDEEGLEVPDPYYGSEKDFEHVYQLTYRACKLLCTLLT